MCIQVAPAYWHVCVARGSVLRSPPFPLAAMYKWRPKITPAVGGVAKAKAKAKALRQEFQDNQEHWRRRIAEKGPEDEMRAEIASRWQQWSIDHTKF